MLFATEWTDVAMTFIMVVLVPLVGWIIKQGWDIKNMATAAKASADDAKQMINGRMNQLLQKAREEAYAQGRLDGITSVGKTMADDANTSLEAKAIGRAMQNASDSTIMPSPMASIPQPPPKPT